MCVCGSVAPDRAGALGSETQASFRKWFMTSLETINRAGLYATPLLDPFHYHCTGPACTDFREKSAERREFDLDLCVDLYRSYF